MAQVARKELISEKTGTAVHSAFHALGQSVVIRNAPTLEDMVSLEGMVREMVQPMLREWLDDNLPKMVERLIRAEIERIAQPPRTASKR
jgi:hypothetical protein